MWTTQIGVERLRAALIPIAVALLAASGVAAARADRAIHAAVAGGHPTSTHTWPWVAQVRINGGICGGSLVAPHWVLTAAHCVHGTEAASVQVVLGRTRRNGTHGKEFPVKTVVEHEKYRSRGGRYANDVALLELSRRAAPTPVSVAGSGDEDLWAPGQEVRVLGWGLTGTSGQPSNDLRVATVPMVSDTSCRHALAGFDAHSMVCAGNMKHGGVDTCDGDSGGPLVSTGSDTPVLVGVTSWGEECAKPGKPGVYARLGGGNLLGWVDRHTGRRH
jgi:secreted trypsin-like serine protease